MQLLYFGEKNFSYSESFSYEVARMFAYILLIRMNKFMIHWRLLQNYMSQENGPKYCEKNYMYFQRSSDQCNFYIQSSLFGWSGKFQLSGKLAISFLIFYRFGYYCSFGIIFSEAQDKILVDLTLLTILFFFC